jgi:hypothetical protein
LRPVTRPRQHPFRLGIALSGGLWVPRAFRLPAFASWPSCPARASAPSYDKPTADGRPYRGFHVSHRQAASGELASRRRERGTVSGGPLIPVDLCSNKDASTPFRPLLRYDASTKASLAFNSIPTFLGIDFGCGCLLSFCVCCLLETKGLPLGPGSMETGVRCLPGLVGSDT